MLFSSSSSTSTILLPLLATSTIILASGFYFGGWFRNDKNTTLSSTSTTTTSNPTHTNTTPRLKNVWNAAPSVPATFASSSANDKVSSSSSNKNTKEKPFGSSYYYAHNNPNAKGGYKDGLKMEDYTMNGPRLLTKGGKPVVPVPLNETMSDTTECDASPSMASSENRTLPPQEASSRNDDDDNKNSDKTNKSNSSSIPIRSITKYLWDDPGDSNGIATIRIDSLPSLSSSSSMMDWSTVSVTKVEAELMGEGLWVRVHGTSPQPVLYELKIPKLYGDAESVQAVVKPKRLLIKITKKRKQSSTLFSFKHSNSNLDVWPQPHRKL
jgi:hypothetical protein